MQNSGGQRNTISMEPGFVKARRFIQERIYDYLMQRKQTQELAPKKVMDIVRRLEEGLFKTATTKVLFFLISLALFELIYLVIVLLQHLESLHIFLHTILKEYPFFEYHKPFLTKIYL